MKISNPRIFTHEFGLTQAQQKAIKFVNIAINVDTKLFIDPLLLEASQATEINTNSYKRINQHFEKVIKLLKASKAKDDVAWKAAEKLFQFDEISWTCLGYSSAKISGTGFSKEQKTSLLQNAKEIVDIGCEDPELFLLLALFEEGVGPDKLSDMTTKIIAEDLAQFTMNTCASLGIKTENFILNTKSYDLPRNNASNKRIPVLLVPDDIVRKLPISLCWSDITDVIDHNQALRKKMNEFVGTSWKKAVERDNEKKRLLSNREAFEAALKGMKNVPKTPYDSNDDKSGELFWKNFLTYFSAPQTLPSLSTTKEVVELIIAEFKHLVEDSGLWKELWLQGNKVHRNEHAAQMLFFAIAHSFCVANNIDLTPEADSGNGPVDFKASKSFKDKAIVEIKLSSNGKTVSGYTNQLAIYAKAMQPCSSHFLLIDVGKMGKKEDEIRKVIQSSRTAKVSCPEFYVVDAKPKKSASKKP